MMRLPAGATGFQGPPADLEVDVRALATICFHAARALGGTITAVVPASATPNFHSVDFVHDRQHMTVLRHASLPFVAFADPCPPGHTELVFRDHPRLVAAVTQTSDLQVLTTEQLNSPLSAVDLRALHPDEHHQIAYWKPHTVGELLFNFWD